MLRRPPLWALWALAIVVGVAAVASVVIADERAGPDGSTSEAGAEAEIGRIADITITEDQAPHFASLSPGSAPTSALERAIERNVRQRITDGQLTGPLQGVTCKATGAATARRKPYRCTVHSADIAYLFLAVVDERRQRLAWCKIDPPAAGGGGGGGGPEVPISASCRA